MKAVLVLKDGTVIWGRGFGAPRIVVGEVVFTTSMVGYTESLTDPSYAGQILVFTYPLIGNYGVPPYEISDKYGLPLHFESSGIKVEGVVVHEPCFKPSHWALNRSFVEWLEQEEVPGIWGVDTRGLAAKLREEGVTVGALAVYEEDEDLDLTNLFEIIKSMNYDKVNFVKKVSVEKPVFYGEGGRSLIAVLDCGVKHGILRSLLAKGFDVMLLPYNTPADKVDELAPAGIVISNGPGNPELLNDLVEKVKALVEYRYPLLGICLGHQIISLALGASTYKLRYGHRGSNKPCIDLKTGRCFVTSQNHGYAVDMNSLKESGVEIWFINADDKSVEGIINLERKILGVQFHPEASPGPNDTAWVFDVFAHTLIKNL
ncbi:MAG: glutamine-hydrolyzing carbamoyl-phosphate synthase small subunit [Thermofilaceae archaeon]